MKLSAFVVVLVIGGCAKDRGDAGSARAGLGHERGDCRPATEPDAPGSCDPGLLCLSNLCVRPPPADCQVVADQFASMELGNYAEPEARAPVVARYRAACHKAMVSKEQGACLEQARDKWAAAQCAPLMFPELQSKGSGACAPVVDKMRAAMGKMGTSTDPQTQKMMAMAMNVIGQSCEQDAWPDALKNCILLASDSGDAMNNACKDQMPPELQQKISARMTEAMQMQMP